MKAFSVYRLIQVLVVVAAMNTATEGAVHHDIVEMQLITVPTQEFDSGGIEDRFRRALAAKDTVTRLLQLQAMDRPQSINLNGMGYTDITYGLWRLLFEDYEKQIPPFAELVALNGNAAMRLRDSQGHVTLKVLEGQNPYEISACGIKLSILHISRRDILAGHNADARSVSLSFFLLSKETATESIARCALREFEEMKLAKNIEVTVRNDPWFIQDSDFPVVWPFLEEIHPPSKQEYEKAPQWNCGSGEYLTKTECFGWQHL